MRPVTRTYTATAAHADNICESQKGTNAGNMTIDGALATAGVATLDIPRHIVIDSDGAESTVTFTIYGTDRYGLPISEVLVGADHAANSTSVKNYKTITRIARDKSNVGNVIIGTANSFEGEWIPVEHHATNTSVQVDTSSTGFTHTVQYTHESPWDADETTLFGTVFYEACTGDKAAAITVPCTAVRLVVTGYSSGSAELSVLQAGEGF